MCDPIWFTPKHRFVRLHLMRILCSISLFVVVVVILHFTLYIYFGSQLYYFGCAIKLISSSTFNRSWSMHTKFCIRIVIIIFKMTELIKKNEEEDDDKNENWYVHFTINKFITLSHLKCGCQTNFSTK